MPFIVRSYVLISKTAFSRGASVLEGKPITSKSIFATLDAR